MRARAVSAAVRSTHASTMAILSRAASPHTPQSRFVRFDAGVGGCVPSRPSTLPHSPHRPPSLMMRRHRTGTSSPGTMPVHRGYGHA